MTKEDIKKLVAIDWRYEIICNRCKISCIYEGFYQRMGGYYDMAVCNSFEEKEELLELIK